jgi:hypothetical protein
MLSSIKLLIKMKFIKIILFTYIILIGCKKEETSPAFEVHRNGHISGKISGYSKDSVLLNESFSWNIVSSPGHTGYSMARKDTNGYIISFARYAETSDSYFGLNFNIDSLNNLSKISTGLTLQKYMNNGEMLDYYISAPGNGSSVNFSDIDFNKTNGIIKGKYRIINTINKNTSTIEGDFNVNLIML